MICDVGVVRVKGLSFYSKIQQRIRKAEKQKRKWIEKREQ